MNWITGPEKKRVTGQGAADLLADESDGDGGPWHIIGFEHDITEATEQLVTGTAFRYHSSSQVHRKVDRPGLAGCEILAVPVAPFLVVQY